MIELVQGRRAESTPNWEEKICGAKGLSDLVVRPIRRRRIRECISCCLETLVPKATDFMLDSKSFSFCWDKCKRVTSTPAIGLCINHEFNFVGWRRFTTQESGETIAF